MTDYGTGAAPLLFSQGFVDMSGWWKIGALISVVNVVIWFVTGGIRWKIFNLW